MLYVEKGRFIFNDIDEVYLSHLASAECKHQPCFSSTSVLAITEHQMSVVSRVLSDCFLRHREAVLLKSKQMVL